MNLTKVHLFVILLLALVGCSFLGGTCRGGAGAGLEGFNLPSDTRSYKGHGHDKPSGHTTYSKRHDAAYPRKDNAPTANYKPSNSGDADDDMSNSNYTPYVSRDMSRPGSEPGIPANQIIRGQEDMYILKSEIVPPVCPACPATKCDGGDKTKCPPCPPCARCPEPAFECKKVPNYNSGNDDVIPRPVLNSFSQFGM